MNHDVIHPVAGVEKQPTYVGHALGVVGGKEEEGQSDSFLGAHVEHLQFFQRAQDERVRLGASVNDVNRGGIFEHAPKQTEQGGLAFVLIAKLVRAHILRVTAGEGVMTVVQVGAVPLDAKPVKPGDAEFGFKAFAEIAFGLRIEMDTSGDVHTFVGSLRLRLSGFGALNGRARGVEASTVLRDGSAEADAGCSVASRSQCARTCRAM